MREATKKTDIPQKVKRTVYERDGGACVICGRAGIPNAHFISRAQMGLGIEQNIVTLCPRCHRDYDQSEKREAYRAELAKYLAGKYDGWDPDKLIYRKRE